jgi:hypothetical protein
MTRKKPVRHLRPWNATDLKKMRALAKRKLSARLAALKLGRTAGAVKYKAMVEGIRFSFVEQPRGVQRRIARRKRQLRRSNSPP